MKLFTPGPVSVPKTILKAAAQPILFHRTKPFEKLYADCCRKLLRVFQADNTYTCLIITGSGSMACEMAIASYFRQSDLVLVLENGDFAKRWVEVLMAYNIPHIVYKKAWGESFQLNEVKDILQQKKPTAVLMVAMETSTGMVNPVSEVGMLCRANHILYFADAVSALGIEDINVKRDSIDIIISVANKGLESIPGVGIICLSSRILKRDAKKRSICSPSLDMWKHLEYAKKYQTPFTPAVTVYSALNTALDILLREGLAERRSRYRKRSQLVVQEARRLGIPLFIREAQYRSTAVNSFLFPAFVAMDALQQYLFSHGFTIWYRKYQDPRLQNMAQVAVMGAITKRDIAELFVHIQAFLEKKKK